MSEDGVDKKDLKVRCPWCVYNQFRCRDEDESTCDFKSLPMERDAIILRMRSEVGWMKEVRSRIANGTVDAPDVELMLRDASDRGQGVQIMAVVLKDKFGMTADQVRAETGLAEASFVDKMRIAMKLGVLKAARSGATQRKANADAHKTNARK